MTYRISQYLSCPRRYKHRYLDGWKEKDTRAAMMFGRAFEQAVAAYFRRKDASAALYREWSAHRDSGLSLLQLTAVSGKNLSWLLERKFSIECPVSRSLVLADLSSGDRDASTRKLPHTVG